VRVSPARAGGVSRPQSAAESEPDVIRPMTVTRRIAVLLIGAFLLTACSGIPGSGDVHDVTKVANPVSEQAPATPVPGMRPDAVVRGFIAAAARISVAGTAGSAYSAPKQYLTAKAQQSWQPPQTVAILSDQGRVDPSPADSSVITISGTSGGTLDRDKAYHSGNGATYRIAVHLVQEGGQWRITDPPAELLILDSDFRNVFAARTIYFLDSTRTVVVPDRRYLIKASNKPENRVATLISLLIQGPAGVLKGAALSELTGGSLRTTVALAPDGVTTKIDLLGVKLPTPADRNALVAQVVWTLYPEPSQVAISLDGVPLDRKTPTYTLSTVQSFNPDRVPGNGSVATDPYLIDPRGAIIDLQTRTPLYGPVGTGSAQVQSAAMSAANGTLAAVSNVRGKAGQALLIGQPLNLQVTARALEAPTLTQPSFSRSGDEVWVVQNGASKNPEVYQISTSLTSPGTTGTGTASRAKVGVTQLAGKGAVTALTLSPDGVRVAIVAGGKLYVGAIAAPANTATTRATPPATSETPEALTLINLQELRGELDSVGPVAFRSASQILIVSKNPSLSYRSIVDMPIDGSDAKAVTSQDLTADVQGMAVSKVGSDPSSTAGVGADAPDSYPGRIYVSVGLADRVGTILELQGSLSAGRWATVDPALSTGMNPFFPD